MDDAIQSTTGKKISAGQAVAAPNDWRGAFCCPCCGEDVFVRFGPSRAPHFAHFSTIAAQRCQRFNSILSDGSGPGSPPRLARLRGRVVEVWTPSLGWRPAELALQGGPAFFGGLHLDAEMLELQEAERVFAGSSYLVLGPSDELPRVFEDHARVVAVLSAWTAWEVTMPDVPSPQVQAWLKSVGHPWSPPSFRVRGTVLGARSGETEGVLACATGDRILLDYAPTPGLHLAHRPLFWQVQREGKTVVERLQVNGQFQDEAARLWFRAYEPGEWGLVPLCGGAAPLWIQATGPSPGRHHISLGFEIHSAGA